MHLATRVLKCQGFFSDWIVPIRSILAGCVQSVAWSRVYWFDVLEKIHRDFFPSTIIFGSMTPDKGRVGQRTRSCLVRGLEELGSKMSIKSTVLGQPAGLAHRLPSMLAIRGIQ
eukprot:4019291-Heterocapsa_arctica.AAC.1